ncbi:MAG: HAD family phosphatase, partial [Verrucomicrobia bacterium]|nr:HAD family phosphatase [Verrucomicrobiota bacterium]
MKKTLFIDIGGVVLTNGWDRVARAEACHTFGLDQKELDNRHALMFDTYELGRISLLEYLKQVVFYTPRDFSEEQFIQFMYDQSKPYQETIDMLIE